MSELGAFALSCPIPISDYPQVLLAHGGGGRLMNQLIGRMFAPSYLRAPADATSDGAVLGLGGERLAFTTDSYVVSPLVFPGGDIGTLAVNGTVNDLAMCGARPLYLSVGMIVEEGLPMETLWRVAQSLRAAAAAANVQIVTGDTKVVDRGKGDGLFINTAGIGRISYDRPIGPVQVRRGDAVLLSGDLGRHGMAIMAAREGLEFETTIVSDCAPLAGMALGLLDEGVEVHCMRDLTRGGLASALVEIAEAAGVHIRIEERRVPVDEQVRGACEILGLDPLYVANEGRFVCFVPEAQAEHALAILRGHAHGAAACRIGTVGDGAPGMVSMVSLVGASRIVDMLSGEQLPRIC